MSQRETAPMTEPTATRRIAALTLLNDLNAIGSGIATVEARVLIIEQAILAAEAPLQSQVAALREALRIVVDRPWGSGLDPAPLEAVLADTAASAEAYTARIREKALEDFVNGVALTPEQEARWLERMKRALATSPATEEAK